MSKVAFVGGGSFGTALAVLLSKKGNDVYIYDRDEYVVNDIEKNKRNSKYLPELIIPDNIKATTEIEKATKDCDYLVVAVPSHVVRTVAKQLNKVLDKNVIVICIAKGIEEGTDKRLSVVLSEELKNDIVILSGPSHAEEIAKGIPTTIVATSKNMKKAEEVQDLFMTEDFRVYTNDDIIGVEVGGAVKNVIALAAGVVDGLGYGDNTKAALMTRGMKEIAKIGVALGGKQETFYGLTGMGDLIVTCTSMHSRNRRAGILIGKGKSLEEAQKEVGMVVEGVKACKAFYELSKKMNIELPITTCLYKALFESKNPRKAVGELMVRDKKSEI